MCTNRTATADVIIFGGGVAGLWLLNRLRGNGLSAILLEADTLGGGQTHKSQGILHGGMKYALQGVMTSDATAMAQVPTRWNACLAGQGEINLSQVEILSHQQHLWSPHKLTSKITGFLAGAALKSKVQSLAQDQYPAVFRHSQFKGHLFALDEKVINVTGLIEALSKPYLHFIFKMNILTTDSFIFDQQGQLTAVVIQAGSKTVVLKAQQYIFTAGAGNAAIIAALKSNELAMQRRPLHMVLAKFPVHYPLYAHCLGLGARPRLTITTHRTHDSRSVWYLGGVLAEDGVARTREAQIVEAQKELKSLFPWLDFSDSEWASMRVDRAEPAQKSGLKPETSYVKKIKNIIVGWPTKLALAPKLADEIAEQMTCTPQPTDLTVLEGVEKPALAVPIWESLFCKSI